MTKKINSYLYLTLCIFFWGLAPVASKKALIELNNLQILFYSTIFSMLIVGGVLVAQKKVSLLKNLSIKNYSYLSFLGFLGIYLYYILLYGAFTVTTASEGFTLAYTWPIAVLILAFIILHEKVTFRKILSILISFLGIVVIVTHGNISAVSFTNLPGDVMALSGAFIFALFSVLGKKNRLDRTVSVFIYFLASLILLIPTILFFSSFKLPSTEVWAWVILNGLFINGVSYIWWFKALENADTHIISTLLYLTPFVSLVFISLFLNEQILVSSMVGLGIIVVGILTQSLSGKYLKKISQIGDLV